MARIQTKTSIKLYVINKVREMKMKLKILQAQLALHLNITLGFIGSIEPPERRDKYNLNHINKITIGPFLLSCS